MNFNKLSTGVASVGAALALSLSLQAKAQEANTDGLEHLNPTVVAQIVADFSACVADNIAASDWDANGAVEATPAQDDFDEADFLADMNKSCDTHLNSQVSIAESEQQLVDLDQDIAVAREGTALAMNSIKTTTADLTQDILNTSTN